MNPLTGPAIGSAAAPVEFRRPTESAGIVLKTATSACADAIHALISAHRAEGRLLARARDEIRFHVHRFVVALDGDEIVGCADLAPLSRSLAEVRSLVVAPHVRSTGLGRRIVGELAARAAAARFERLCVLTHVPSFFAQLGFSIVPHVWLPAKIETDCRTCTLFRRCGQYAMILDPLVPCFATSRSNQQPAG